jgi:hypothetical protein
MNVKASMEPVTLYMHTLKTHRATELLLSHLRGNFLSGNRAKRERNSADRAAMSPGSAGTGDLLDDELTALSAWLAEGGFCVTQLTTIICSTWINNIIHY